MTQFPVSTSNEQSIYGALELSKNSWLLAIQVRAIAWSGSTAWTGPSAHAGNGAPPMTGSCNASSPK